MKLLTFLGATKAYETEYLMPDGRTYVAPYCGIALAHFYPGTIMRVFVTGEARRMHLEPFQRLVENNVSELEPVDISDGKNESQLWEIFQTVVNHVDQGEEIIFDLTHGFRSLPFLSFLAIAYLRVVKEIRVRAVLYGNFEARDRSVTPNRTPIIDLTTFVNLLDWMTAADRFVRFGDAQDLGRLLKATKPDHRLASGEELAVWTSAGIGKAIKALDNVSLALRLIRPSEAMEASNRLQTRLVNAMQDIGTYARPFLPLSQQVADAYAPLALSETEQQRDLIAGLARERRMVNWYLERKQYVQALTVAREWIVSWAMVYVGMSDLLDKESRWKIEEAFGLANKQRREQKDNFDDHTFDKGKRLKAIPQIRSALDLYARLGNLRNDLLHAGKRPNPQPAKKMEQDINTLCNELGQLTLPVSGDG